MFICQKNVTATDHYLPIHREAPAFVEQATEQQILVTGIKVFCLIDYYLCTVYLFTITPPVKVSTLFIYFLYRI